MRTQTTALAAAMMVVSAASAEQITVDFAKPVFLKAHRKVCETDAELDAMVRGAPAKCYEVKANLPITVLTTRLTGFMGGGTMHVKARSDSLVETNDLYVDAKDLTNDGEAATSLSPDHVQFKSSRGKNTPSKLDWDEQVVVRPGARACIYLHFPTWEDAKECHPIEGDVAVERVDQPPFNDWIRVVTTDDTEQPAFYVKLQDLENYNPQGQSWGTRP